MARHSHARVDPSGLDLHVLTVGLILLILGIPQTMKAASALRVSENGRYLVQPDGRPFFWLGDTSWLLSQMTTREDVDLYLRTRALQGFTVIQAGIEDYDRTLMTYHINGGNSSSQWFHQTPWLDFNMIQIWGNEKQIYPKITHDYQLTPVKPTGLGEGSYENGPQYPTRPIDALKICQQAYWSYLAGGYHTYGNTNTWNFSSYQPEGTQDWRDALR